MHWNNSVLEPFAPPPGDPAVLRDPDADVDSVLSHATTLKPEALQPLLLTACQSRTLQQQQQQGGPEGGDLKAELKGSKTSTAMQR